MDALRRLQVWKRACRLCVNVYKVSRGCPDLAFRDQLTRAALSVPSNIAEGYERDTPKERCHFLRIAKGSTAECWTQMLIGVEAGLLDEGECKSLIQELEEIAGMLAALVKRFTVQETDAPPSY